MKNTSFSLLIFLAYVAMVRSYKYDLNESIVNQLVSYVDRRVRRKSVVILNKVASNKQNIKALQMKYQNQLVINSKLSREIQDLYGKFKIYIVQ